jgi:hypothetical protein
MQKSLWTIALLFVAIGAPAHAGSIKYTATFACATCSLLPSVINNPVSFPSPYNLDVEWDGATFVFALKSSDAPGDFWSWFADSSGTFVVFTLVDNATIDGYTLLAPISSFQTRSSGKLTFTPVTSATPEPSSLLLFGTSLLALAPFRRKLFGR